MSAGVFLRTRYEADSGEIHPIRVQPETVAANIAGANAAPSGTTTQSISARVNKTNREFGLRPRFVTVRFTSTVPDGYEADNLYRIPILTPSRFTAINVGASGTYLGSDIEVVSKSPENVK